MSKNKSAPTNSKLENLQTQNGKLIEKVESLTQKCNNYEAELLKIEQYKLENKTIADQMLALQGEVLKIEQDNTTDFDGPIHIRVQEKLSTIQKLVQDHSELKLKFVTLTGKRISILYKYVLSLLMFYVSVYCLDKLRYLIVSL